MVQIDIIGNISSTLIAVLVYSLVMYYYYTKQGLAREEVRKRTISSALIFGAIYLIVWVAMDIIVF